MRLHGAGDLLVGAHEAQVPVPLGEGMDWLAWGVMFSPVIPGSAALRQRADRWIGSMRAPRPASLIYGRLRFPAIQRAASSPDSKVSAPPAATAALRLNAPATRPAITAPTA